MSVIIDLNLVCVICLQDGELRSVFDQDDSTTLKISEKIMKCSGLIIEEESKLPDKICRKCIEDLTAAYRFRQNCEASRAVFSTLQQQEDALANYELEQQQIKIPSGLKIKRIQPDIKTYLLPVHVEHDVEPQRPLVSRARSPEHEQAESLELEEVPAVSCENTADDNVSEEEMQMEEVELDDYFESEEVLDEQFEKLIEIKVEKQPAEAITNNASQTEILDLEENEINAVDVVVKIEDPKDEVEQGDNELMAEEDQIMAEASELFLDEDETIAEENKPPIQQFLKRARGRPKNSSGPPSERTSSHKTEVKSETDESNVQSTDDRTTNTSDKKYSVLKPIAHKMRKRHSFSPDSKPTKICEICGNSYKYQHALKAHMRRHNNIRPFHCEFCDKAFVSAVELRRHMRVHTGHKPYACQYCDRRFSDFGSRIKHERTHTGERPYTCPTCGKAFAYAHVLSVHLRTHTGEKKFVCNLCGKGFTKKSYLETHTDQHARAAAIAAIVDSDTTQDGIRGIKNVALEECIFTTEYIEEEAGSTTLLNEEHLDYNENQHTNSSDNNNDDAETITNDYPHMEKVRFKHEKLQKYSVVDDNFEDVSNNIKPNTLK